MKIICNLSFSVQVPQIIIVLILGGNLLPFFSHQRIVYLKHIFKQDLDPTCMAHSQEINVMCCPYQKAIVI